MSAARLVSRLAQRGSSLHLTALTRATRFTCNPFYGRDVPEIKPELLSLVRENAVIDASLGAFGSILANMDQGDGQAYVDDKVMEDLKQYLWFLEHYVSGMHFHKEDALFEVMVKHGFPSETGPVAVLGRGHAVLTGLLVALQKCHGTGNAWSLLQVGTRFGDMLRQHAEKASNVLLPLASEQIPSPALAPLTPTFSALETRYPQAALEAFALEFAAKYNFEPTDGVEQLGHLRRDEGQSASRSGGGCSGVCSDCTPSATCG